MRFGGVFELHRPVDERAEVVVVDRVPIEIAPNEDNVAYLQTKRDRMGYLILADASAHDQAVLGNILDDES